MAFRQRPYRIVNANQQLKIQPVSNCATQQTGNVAIFNQPRPYYRKISLSQQVTPAAPTDNADQTSPQYILGKFGRKLTQLEQDEILGYSKVYYYGQNAQKLYNMQRRNYGYDDSEGDVRPVLRDHVAYRYELTQLIGQGSFGKVFRAFDHCEKRVVALKMLKNRLQFRKQGQVELRILKTLSQGDVQNTSHCLHVLDHGNFRNHIYFCTELLQQDLYALLCKNNLRGLSIERIQKYARQALEALDFAFRQRIIHADIKPENMLISASDDLWIIDWGSGAFVGETIYAYIQSRYYRAPEVILGLPYSTPIDVWSLACVFCEMLTGQPIFPGEEEQDQLGRICEYLGTPPLEIIKEAPKKNDYFWDAGDGRMMLRTNHRAGRKKLETVLSAGGHKFVALVSRMLSWDQKQRPTPAELLLDDFFKQRNAERVELDFERR